MRHNPAASFDLGSFIAAGGYGPEDMERFASTMHVDQPTLDLGAARFETAFDARLDSQIEASMREAVDTEDFVVAEWSNVNGGRRPERYLHRRDAVATLPRRVRVRELRGTYEYDELVGFEN